MQQGQIVLHRPAAANTWARANSDSDSDSNAPRPSAMALPATGTTTTPSAAAAASAAASASASTASITGTAREVGRAGGKPMPRSKAGAVCLRGSFYLLGGGQVFDAYGDVWRLPIHSAADKESGSDSSSFSSSFSRDWEKLYDPTGVQARTALTFSAAVALDSFRYDPDGSIFMVAGFRPAQHSKAGPNSSNAAEATGAASAAASASRVNNVAGDGENTGQLLRFDVRARTWTDVAVDNPLPPRSGHVAAIVKQRFLVVFGGYNGKERLNDLWRLDLDATDPATGEPNLSWELIRGDGRDSDDSAVGVAASAPPPLMNGAGDVLGSWLYVVEGQCGADGANRKNMRLWRIDILGIAPLWEEVAVQAATSDLDDDLPTRRFGQTLSAYGDHQLVMYGGSASDVLVSDLYVFDATNSTWRRFSPLNGESERGIAAPFPSAYHSAAMCGSWLVVFGGSVFVEGERQFASTAFIYTFGPRALPKTMPTDLEQLLHRGTTSDVDIVAIDGSRFPAHMAVLGARCAPLSLQLMGLVAQRHKAQRDAARAAKQLQEHMLAAEEIKASSQPAKATGGSTADTTPARKQLAGAVKIMPSLPPKKPDGVEKSRPTVAGDAPPSRTPPKPAHSSPSVPVFSTSETGRSSPSRTGKTAVLELDLDIPSAVVPTLLKFLYSGEPRLPAKPSLHFLFDLLDAAEQLELLRLAAFVSNYICANVISMDTVIETLLACEAHKLGDLKVDAIPSDTEAEHSFWGEIRKHCDYFILSRYAEVMMLPEFTQLGPELLVTFMRLQQQAMAANSTQAKPALSVVPPSTLAEDLVALHADMDYSDFRLGAIPEMVVMFDDDDDGDGETFDEDDKSVRCHRCILSARTDFFATVFAEGNQWRDGSVPIMELRIGEWRPPLAVARAFVEFLYTDIAPPHLSIEHAVYLLPMCEYYGVTSPRLQQCCIDTIEQGVKIENVVDLLLIAFQTNNHELCKAFVQQIVRSDWFPHTGANFDALERLPKVLLLDIISGAAANYTGTVKRSV